MEANDTWGNKELVAPAMVRKSAAHRAVVGLLVGVFLLQALAGMSGDSATFDETINSAIGYAEIFTGDLSLVNDHPPLVRVLTALPLLVLHPTIPLNHPSWRLRAQGMGDRYDFAYQFFYRANANADSMLFWTRLVVVSLSLVLALLVYQWATDLYGPTAGLLALFFYAFEPNLMAHSRVTTNDLAVTLFIFATVRLYWNYGKHPSWRCLGLAGFSLGLALLTKFSALMLLPMLFFLACLRIEVFKNLMAGHLPDRRSMTAPLFVQEAVRVFSPLVAMGGIALAVILFYYGSQWKLFFEGINNVVLHYQGGHSAFLMGMHSTEGWWYYFPVVFILKTPIPLMLAVLAALLFKTFKDGEAGCFLLVPMAMTALAGLLSHLNIGIRHILPLYPFMIVLASSIVKIRLSEPRLARPLIAAAGTWMVVSTLSIFPGYLGYFNELVGPGDGYRYLVDSNLDWGQDLKRLKGFMKEKGLNQVYLSYFGTADPCYYGIHSIDLPGSYNRCGASGAKSARFLAVSATNLQSVYLPDRETFAWLLPYEPVARVGQSIFVYDIEGDAAAHNNLGIVYLKYGHFETALGEFEQVVRLSPEDPEAQVNLGFVYARLSFFDEAEAAYQKALQLDPDNKIARAGLKGIERKKRKVQPL